MNVGAMSVLGVSFFGSLLIYKYKISNLSKIGPGETRLAVVFSAASRHIAPKMFNVWAALIIYLVLVHVLLVVVGSRRREKPGKTTGKLSRVVAVRSVPASARRQTYKRKPGDVETPRATKSRHVQQVHAAVCHLRDVWVENAAET